MGLDRQAGVKSRQEDLGGTPSQEGNGETSEGFKPRVSNVFRNPNYGEGGMKGWSLPAQERWVRMARRWTDERDPEMA